MAKRSRGTPRIVNRLLKRVRDVAQVRGKDGVDLAVAMETLDMLEIDPLGLDAADKKILKAIIYKFNGGPVGLDTLAASTGEERNTLEDVIEPFLLQLGFINRTPRGRMATKLAYEHFGLDWE